MKIVVLIMTIWCCLAVSATTMPAIAPDGSVAEYKLTDVHMMPAIAVSIPLGIISIPNGEQDIIQPGATFLIVNRLQVTGLLDYVGTLSASISGNAATATQLQTIPTQCAGGFFATGIQATGNANCSNNFPTGGLIFTDIYISGATRTYTAQGEYLNWNISNSIGESDFVNNRGNGGGGFRWYNASASGVLGTPIMTLDFNGVLSPSGGLNAVASSALTLAGTLTQCGSGSIATGIQNDGDANCVALGSSVQAASTTSVCTTGNNSYDTCPSSVTWPIAFANASYAAFCAGITPSNGRALIQGIASQSTTTLTFNVVTEGSVGVTFAKVTCIGVL